MFSKKKNTFCLKNSIETKIQKKKTRGKFFFFRDNKNKMVKSCHVRETTSAHPFGPSQDRHLRSACPFLPKKKDPLPR